MLIDIPAAVKISIHDKHRRKCRCQTGIELGIFKTVPYVSEPRGRVLETRNTEAGAVWKQTEIFTKSVAQYYTLAKIVQEQE